MGSASVTVCDQENVLAALRRPGAFWLDDLAPMLAQSYWRKLQAKFGLNKTSYGTARVLGHNPLAERNLVGAPTKIKTSASTSNCN